MSRPLRIQYPRALYHVMNRGTAKRPTFTDDRDAEEKIVTFFQDYGSLANLLQFGFE